MNYDTIILDELSPDSSDYEHDGLARASNAIPVQSAWREIKGRAAGPTQSLAGADRPLTSFASGATSYLGTKQRLFSFDSVSWADLSKGGAAYAPNVSWSFAQFGSSVIAAPGQTGNVPMQVRNGGAGLFGDLVTSVDRPVPVHLGVVRSVLLGAFLQGGAAAAGFYAGTTDPQQFAWSARGNAADWQVNGTNGAGFGFLKSDGWINGLITSQSYALVFQQYAVTRLDYTGDSNGFQPSGIGYGGLGIPSVAWAKSAVKAGNDVFYFSGLGPCVVYNGETCQLVGGSKTRRYLSDMLSDYGADPSTPIEGTYDPFLGLVIWTIKPSSSVTAGNDIRILVVTEIKHGSFDAYTARFSPQEGRWATIEPGLVTTNVCMDQSIRSAFPLARLRMFEYLSGSNLVQVSGFTDTQSSLPITLVSKIWHPVTNTDPNRQSVLHGVRPVWGIDPNGDPVPVVTVQVECCNDPLMLAGVTTMTLDLSIHDTNHFLSKASLPIVAGYFRFTVTIPSMAAATLREFHGLELAFELGGQGY